MSKKKYTPSRIGKQPVALPDKVEVKVDGETITVKGPRGSLTREFHDVTIELQERELIIAAGGESKRHKAMHGLCRSLLSNMVEGVSQGFTRELQVQGVGYRLEQTGQNVKFSVGFSHPVNFTVPDGVSATVEAQTKLILSSIDKELIGQVAAKMRQIRPPEPYKGKGIRYVNEHVRRKAGKAAGK